MVSRDDIVRAIRTLKPLSGGFEVIQIGSRKMVRSVPKELDKDQSALLLLAQVKIKNLIIMYAKMNFVFDGNSFFLLRLGLENRFCELANDPDRTWLARCPC